VCLLGSVGPSSKSGPRVPMVNTVWSHTVEVFGTERPWDRTVQRVEWVERVTPVLNGKMRSCAFEEQAIEVGAGFAILKCVELRWKECGFRMNLMTPIVKPDRTPTALGIGRSEGRLCRCESVDPVVQLWRQL
jgi:hypothetical protein